MVALPNLLTIFRILCVPLFVGLMALPQTEARMAAFAVFVIAALTDWLDGHLARAMNAHSELGRMLDPIADKLIVAVALLMLAAEQTLSGWSLVPALVILMREILVSGLREFLAGLDVSVPVSRIAKAKTAVQMAALALVILAPAVPELGLAPAGIAALWAAAALTVYTGWGYLVAGLARIR